MAKFCTNCGKELKEGETCDCVKVVTPNQTTNNVGKELIENLKGIFTKPIDTIKENIKDDKFTLSIIWLGIISLLTGLFSMAFIKNCAELIIGGMSSSISYYSMTTPTIELPYAEVFFTTTIAMFILSFALTGILYLVNTKMFKGNASFKETFGLYVTSSIITGVALLASAILMFVYIPLAAIVLLLGMMLNMVYVVTALKQIGPKDENKIGYIYITTMAIFYVVIFIITKIFS